MHHEIQYRVCYADTDQMGVVYYANYLTLFERSRTEMLRDAGLPYRKLEEEGFYLPVSEACCRYRASARYDDLLTIRSWVREMKGVRLTIASEVRRGEEVLVSGHVVLASVNRDGKPTRLSPRLIESCRAFLEEIV